MTREEKHRPLLHTVSFKDQVQQKLYSSMVLPYPVNSLKTSDPYTPKLINPENDPGLRKANNGI